MVASTQSALGPSELSAVLALLRAGTLAGAAQQLGQDGSTVFRGLQRAERALGQRLFERSREGYRATDLGLQLAQHAERIEAELEAARNAARLEGGSVGGTVRISTTDTILHGLLLPALASLTAAHPHLQLDLIARNELANLTAREADIALRATTRPPPHLVGRSLGPIRAAVFGAAPRGGRRVDWLSQPWIAVDEALPEHPSVRWRKRHMPQATPQLLVNSVQSVLEAVRAGLGVGIAPVFLAQRESGLVQLSDALPECETELWLLTHPESRHLRRIATVASHLAGQIRLQ
jgi:DNA-binding transcriptional LysR family regulator